MCCRGLKAEKNMQRTLGIDIANITVDDVEFAVWDYAGQLQVMLPLSAAGHTRPLLSVR